MSAIKVGSYLHVEPMGQDWIVFDRHNSMLATIEWYPQWRRHVMMPQPGTVWSWDCLLAVSEWMHALESAP